MGLMDMVTGALGNAGGSGGNNPLLDSVVKMLTDSSQGGGLAGIAKAFQDKGLGDQMASWVGSGQNLPISADQIKSALSGGQLGQIASQLGINEQQAAGGLADILPQVVDKLTPSGQMPEGDLMAQGLDMLKGKLFG